jgi:DNA-binding MarR family transcriptional regulator
METRNNGKRQPALRAERFLVARPAIDLHDLSHRPGFLLRRAHQVAVAIFTDEVGRIALTPPQHNVLAAVNAHPGSHQAEVSRLVGYDRATVGAVLAGLEERQLIRRESSWEDRRVKTLKLTRRGKQLLNASTAAMARINQRIMAPLTPKEGELFIALLAKVATSNLAGESIAVAPP